MKKSTKEPTPVSVYEFDEENISEALSSLFTDLYTNPNETEFLIYSTDKFEKTVYKNFLPLLDLILSVFPNDYSEKLNKIKAQANRLYKDSCKYKRGSLESKACVDTLIHYLYDLVELFYTIVIKQNHLQL